MGSRSGQGSGIGRRMRAGTRLSRLAAGLLLAAVAVTVAGCSASGSSDSAEPPAAVEGADGGANADGGETRTTADRAVVVEGSMSLSVDDVTASATAAIDLAATAGGRVDARDEQGSGDGEGNANLTLRIPADGFDAVVEDLRELGEVDHLSTSSTDVTDAVIDVDARIAALEQTIARLQGFQQAAADVTDLIDLETELRSRQGELEQLQAEQSSLADRVDWSTLHLELHAEGAGVGLLPGDFGTAVVTGWEGMVGFFSGLFIVLGLLLPWIVLGGVITAVVLLLVRFGRARRARRAAQNTAPPAGPGGPAGSPPLGPVDPSMVSGRS